MKKKFLLTHQTYFMLAPYLFPEIRFFIFTAGYGAGKTSSISTAILYDVQQLQGKTDREGHDPRIILGGVSLGHLKKTTVAYIIEDLKNSDTPYEMDTKDNILTVGNVHIYLVSLSVPSKIMGFDVVAAYGDEVDDLGAVAVSAASDITFEAVKALNERTRQVIPGFRKSFVKLASTSQGQLGLYRVVSQFNKEKTGYIRIKARTKDNFYLPKEYVESQYKFYTLVEQKVYMEGEFLSVGAGRILPDFDWDKNFVRRPLDKAIKPDEEIFWSQDFNSLSRYEKVLTINGYRPIMDIKVGDYVWTRQGYKRVLTNKMMGEKIVVRCGKLWTTLNHPFITPKGDEPRWQIKNYYYLKKRSRLKLHLDQIQKTQIKQLEYFSIKLSGENKKGTGILLQVKDQILNFSIEQSMNITLGRFLKDTWSITKTALLITGLKALNFLHEKIILRHTNQEKESKSIGKRVLLKPLVWCVLSVAKHLLVKSLRLKPAQMSVEKNSEQQGKRQPGNNDASGLVLKRIRKRGKMGNLLNWFAGSVALSLKERKGLITALRALQPVLKMENGTVLYGVKREIWDLEVEDAHEFFAENILVHNAGYFRGCAAVLRGNTVFVVKRYEFTQIAEAPTVLRYDFPTNKIIFIPDASSNKDILTFSKELRKNKIFWAMRSKNPNIEDTVFLVNKLLYTRRLIFTELAKESAEACALAQRDPNTGKVPKGIGPKSPIHDLDAIRMLCYFLIFKPEMRDIRMLTVQRHTQQAKGILEDQGYYDEAAVTETAGGYSVVNPKAIRNGVL